MEIIEATIHRLVKAVHTHGERSVTLQMRNANLPIDETLGVVSRDLLALYGRTSDSSGTFGNNPTLHLFPVRFNDYLRGELTIAGLTQATVDLIANQIASVRLANGGYALFLRYSCAIANRRTIFC